MMMMYNQYYVDQMDVDVRHLEMVVGNTVVENRLHLDLLIDRNYWIHQLYSQNDLIDPRLNMDEYKSLFFSIVCREYGKSIYLPGIFGKMMMKVMK